MPMIYLAGPYRDTCPSGILDNIMSARKSAVALWQEFGHKAIFFCPHLNTFLMDGICDDRIWLKAGLAFLRRSDAVFLLPGWVKSSGSCAEVRVALKNKIPIFVTLIQLGNWLRHGHVPDNEYELRQLSAQRLGEK